MDKAQVTDVLNKEVMRVNDHVSFLLQLRDKLATMEEEIDEIRFLKVKEGYPPTASLLVKLSMEHAGEEELTAFKAHFKKKLEEGTNLRMSGKSPYAGEFRVLFHKGQDDG